MEFSHQLFFFLSFKTRLMKFSCDCALFKRHHFFYGTSILPGTKNNRTIHQKHENRKPHFCYIFFFYVKFYQSVITFQIIFLFLFTFILASVFTEAQSLTEFGLVPESDDIALPDRLDQQVNKRISKSPKKGKKEHHHHHYIYVYHR